MSVCHTLFVIDSSPLLVNTRLNIVNASSSNANNANNISLAEFGRRKLSEILPKYKYFNLLLGLLLIVTFSFCSIRIGESKRDQYALLELTQDGKLRLSPFGSCNQLPLMTDTPSTMIDLKQSSTTPNVCFFCFACVKLF
jgi:hypothetical protein